MFRAPNHLAAIEDDCIVIRVPISALPFAFENSPYASRYPEGEAPKVDDAEVFADAVVDWLNNEREDGSTLATDCIDQAMAKVVEHGEGEGLIFHDD